MQYSYLNTISVTIYSNIWIGYVMIGPNLKVFFIVFEYPLFAFLNENNEPTDI